MLSILQYIFSWEVCAFGLAILIPAVGLMVADEFKKFSAARVCLYVALVWIYGTVIMWAIFTHEKFFVRAVLTFLVFGSAGVVFAEALRLTNHRETALKAEQEPKKPDVQQNSSGSNSPNINIPGNQNQVIIYPPVSKPNGKAEATTGFHEAQPEEFSVSLGSVSATINIDQLKKNKVVTPFAMYGATPFKLSLGKHNELLFSFVSWGNGVKVEVNDNQVKIGNSLLDRNFSKDAFEIVDRTGEPIFQMIRSPSNLTVNGIFPTPDISPKTGLPIILWISKENGIMFNSTRPDEFKLKPIFKYPSWKFKGQYAD